MKEYVITVPDGYEFDKENSNIQFKPIKPQLPKRWEDLESVTGWDVNDNSIIKGVHYETHNYHRNTFPTKEQAEACIALAQLLQLRKAWVGDWKPDWNNNGTNKYCITVIEGKIELGSYQTVQRALSFPTREMCNDFMNEPEIRKLLEIAKPLL